ncbi:MAG: hypothetical protein J6X44_07890 [Thermoguttaceae bacterium]|nr:hypothetical protein [Thermoguttaceae bacterium]
MTSSERRSPRQTNSSFATSRNKRESPEVHGSHGAHGEVFRDTFKIVLERLTEWSYNEHWGSPKELAKKARLHSSKFRKETPFLRNISFSHCP